MVRSALLLFTLLVLAAPAEAQLLKEINESARQKVEDRKARTRAHVVGRATEPVDSALERGIGPVDSLVSKAATGAGTTVSRLGRGDEAAAADEERRLMEALGQDGRADLSALEFAPGSAAPEPGAERYLASAAKVLAMEENAFLVEGRVGMEEPPGDPSLGKQRAAAVKAALVAAGIPASRLFSVGRREASDGAVVSLVRIQ